MSTKTVFSLTWDKYFEADKSDNGFFSENRFIWKGHSVIINVHCFWGKGPGGYRAYFVFTVNGKEYKFGMLDTYVKGTYGETPRIETDDLKLNIKVLPTSIVITEEGK